MNKEKIILEVTEANRNYQDKNLVTMSDSDMESLGIDSGDIIKLSKEKDLYLRVVRTSDIFSGKIGINGEVRSVLGISVGEKISVSKAEKIPKLKAVTLSILPHEEFSNEQLKGFNDQLKSSGIIRDRILNSPLTIGQKIAIP